MFHDPFLLPLLPLLRSTVLLSSIIHMSYPPVVEHPKELRTPYHRATHLRLTLTVLPSLGSRCGSVVRLWKGRSEGEDLEILTRVLCRYPLEVGFVPLRSQKARPIAVRRTKIKSTHSTLVLFFCHNFTDYFLLFIHFFFLPFLYFTNVTKVATIKVVRRKVYRREVHCRTDPQKRLNFRGWSLFGQSVRLDFSLDFLWVPLPQGWDSGSDRHHRHAPTFKSRCLGKVTERVRRLPVWVRGGSWHSGVPKECSRLRRGRATVVVLTVGERGSQK